jgi:Protein of unknown function (DUF3987)
MTGSERNGERSEESEGTFASFALSRRPLDGAALIGLPGELVQTIAPHTEADPVALLIHFLTMFGNTVGDGPHIKIGFTKHPARLFAVIVGDAAVGRKGTAGDAVERLMELAAPDWYASRMMRGAQSAEAIIERVDDHADDSRLLIFETEFGRLLSTMHRRGNLSSTLKSAFDGKPLEAATRSSRTSLRATRANVSVIGHITPAELSDRLSDVELSSGFGSRFLYLTVSRSKRLPFGDQLDDEVIEKLAAKITDALDTIHEHAFGRADPISAELHTYFGTTPSIELGSTEEFQHRWDQLRVELEEERPPGAAGIVADRPETHVLRLAVAYALADSSTFVDVEHLEAACALWRYAVESARQIFGGMSGSTDADRVLRELQRVKNHRLSRSDIWSIFGRHASRAKINLIVEQLLDTGLVERRDERTEGRNREVYVLRETTNEAKEGEPR